MRRRLSVGLALAAALAICGAAEAATPVVVAQAQTVGFGTTWPTSTSATTGNCSAGAAVAFVQVPGQDPSAFTDSTGATWTLVNRNHTGASIAIWKRMIGSSPIVSGSTYFTVTASSAASGMLAVLCLSDATGIPTTADVSGWPGTNGYLGSGGSGNVSALTGVSAANSYQLAAYVVQNATINASTGFPASGSDSSWNTTQLVNMQDGASYGTTNDSMAIIWRKASTTSSVSLSYAASGFTNNLIGWAEVAASGGGGGPTAKPQSLNLLGVQ